MLRPQRKAALNARELFQADLANQEEDVDDFEDFISSDDEDIGFDVFEVESSGSEEDDGRMYADMEIDEADEPQRHIGNRMLSYDDPDVPVEILDFHPTSPPGPQIVNMPTYYGPEQYSRAIDFFQLFFSMEIIKMLTDATNIYGDLHILKKQTYATLSDGSWKDVTENEMLKFLALVIYMGFVHRADLTRYWSQATLYAGGWAPRFMSRNRFKAILGMLHVIDPNLEDPDDKLTKVRPLMIAIQESYKKMYTPHQNLSVDERMVRSKGRSGIKQYIPQKPVRFGIKVWCICEASTGYTCDFSIYTGRRESASSHGLGYDVVTSLSEEYKNQGYVLFFDNFFTSLPLMQQLKTDGIQACGTTLSTRRGFPEVLKDKEWIKQARRGDMRYQRVHGILCLQWFDKRAVCLCSTLHKGNDYVTVERNSKDRAGNHERVKVKKPLSVYDYNKNMGGVDLSDQRLATYSILMKSMRWWKTLFFHMMDMSILNAYIMFEAWRKAHPNQPSLQRPAGYSHLSFREELVRQMAGFEDDDVFTGQGSPERPLGTGPFCAAHMPEVAETRKNCRVCYALYRKEQKTPWRCPEKQCDVHLCLNVNRNCYRLWHSHDFDEYR